MVSKPRIYTNSKNYVNELLTDEVEIILDDVEFAWRKSDITEVVKMWNKGEGIKYIASKVDRNIDETFLLLLHLAREDVIKKRDSFIWGNRDEV